MISDAFAEMGLDVILHQEQRGTRSIGIIFSVNIKILMPQNSELRFTQKYTNSMTDIKQAKYIATGAPVTDFNLMHGVHVLLDYDSLLKSRLSARVGIYLRCRLRGGVILYTKNDIFHCM